MAKSKSLLKLEGTIEGLTFYRTRDGLIVRRKSSLNYERIKTGPEFVNLRKSGSDFGHCSHVGKPIRLALIPFLTGLSGRDMHNRVVKHLQEIVELDTNSPKGERKVVDVMRTPEGKALWKQFSFIGKNDIQNSFSNNLIIDAKGGTITLPSWSSDTFQKSPEAATHIQLQFVWLDYSFDGNLTPALVQSTAIHPLDTDIPAETLSFAIRPSSTGMITLFLSTQYYQAIEGQHYPLYNQLGRMVGVVGQI